MSASPPSVPHTVALPVSPASVLVLGNGASALQLGRALQSQGVQVSFVSDLACLCERSKARCSGCSGVSSADLVLFGVEPDQALLMARQLQGRVPVGTPVMAMLPGIRRLAWIAHAAPGLHWIRCVVRHAEGTDSTKDADAAHRPCLYLSENVRVRRWRASLERAGYSVDMRSDMGVVQWGQALLQLAALMALVSDRPYPQLLKDRSWRTRLARLWEEALRLLTMSGIDPMPMLGVPWRVAPLLLKVSDAPFAWLASRHFLAVEGEVGELIPWDGPAMEMAVDASCGEFMRLALGLGEDAPCAVGLAQQLKATGRLLASPSERHSVEVV